MRFRESSSPALNLAQSPHPHLHRYKLRSAASHLQLILKHQNIKRQKSLNPIQMQKRHNLRQLLHRKLFARARALNFSTPKKTASAPLATAARIQSQSPAGANNSTSSLRIVRMAANPFNNRSSDDPQILPFSVTETIGRNLGQGHTSTRTTARNHVPTSSPCLYKLTNVPMNAIMARIVTFIDNSPTHRKGVICNIIDNS